MHRTAFSLLAGISLLGVSMSASAATDVEVLRNEVAQLKDEVARLRSATGDNWLTEQRAGEIRSLVQDVLADADTRASLLGSGMSAGYDNGFFLASADNNFRLKIGGRVQFRYVYNYQSSPGIGGDRHRTGFENRRTRLNFEGHVVNPSWVYQVQGDFTAAGGGFTALDVWAGYKFENGMMVRAGQFRPGFMFEDSTSSARQLAVERSLVNARFAQGRTQGVELSGTIGDNVRWSGMFSEGFRSTMSPVSATFNNTNWAAYTTELALSGRAEILLAGNWRQFREFTSWSGESFGMMIGAGFIYQQDEYGTAFPFETEVIRWTVDATMKFGGANAFIAFVGNHENVKNGGNVSQWGLVAQGGFFIVPDDIELFGRFEWGDADTTGVKDLAVVTVGVNKYFSKHAVKWTTDVGYGINEVAPFWGSRGTGAGWRSDATGDKGQLVIRSQLQLVF